MIAKRILDNIFKQVIAWKANLDVSLPNRVRSDCNDIGIVQSIQFWLRSYYNGLVLIGWVSK